MRTLITLIIGGILLFFYSCNSTSESIKEIYAASNTDTVAYHSLRVLCKEYPNRLGGTANSIKAINFLREIMEKENFDTVYLQECIVKHWDRGEKEIGKAITSKGDELKLNVCALGNSIATPKGGISSEVVEVKSFEELEKLGKDFIKGKIVFFSRAMDSTKVNSFEGYGEVVGFRFSGAAVAARYGAEAVLVRSVTTRLDTFPHTGVMRYNDTIKPIPAFAISTVHANLLSKELAKEPKLKVFIKSDCKFLADEKSYNVIGEVKGSKFPNEVITVGGHLDSWDNTEGAHDDGGGLVQSIDVWRIFKKIGYKPEHTLKVVMFIDEEMNQRGGEKYAELAKLNGEKHIFAIESDAGCDRPIGFSFDLKESHQKQIYSYREYFEPYGATMFANEGSGVDIEFLKEGHDAVLCALITDPTHYFDYHHSGYDTFERINIDYLNQGSAAMASLIYLVDKYGIK